MWTVTSSTLNAGFINSGTITASSVNMSWYYPKGDDGSAGVREPRVPHPPSFPPAANHVVSGT